MNVRMETVTELATRVTGVGFLVERLGGNVEALVSLDRPDGSVVVLSDNGGVPAWGDGDTAVCVYASRAGWNGEPEQEEPIRSAWGGDFVQGNDRSVLEDMLCSVL